MRVEGARESLNMDDDDLAPLGFYGRRFVVLGGNIDGVDVGDVIDGAQVLEWLGDDGRDFHPGPPPMEAPPSVIKVKRAE